MSSSEGDGSPGLRLGTVAGVPVYLATSWFVVAAIVVLTFGPSVAHAAPHLGTAGAYLVALVYAVLLAVSVLCHEAAHALVARRCGYVVERVVVNLWGGHTAFGAPAPTPGRSALVSVSGPVANGLLAALGWLILGRLGLGVGWLLCWAWTVSNAFVAVVNLLPGLPLDGGFLLDALVWRITGRRSAGLVTAGWAGRLLTGVAVWYFLVWPFLSGGGLSLWSVAWFAFLGAFLWSGAGSAIAAGRSLRVLERVPLDAVLRPVAAVPAGAAAALVPRYVGATPGALPVIVDDAGRPLGLVDPDAWRRLPAEQAGGVPVGALLLTQPAGWVAPARAPRATADGGSARATVAPYLAALAETPYGVVVLAGPDGRPAGALTSEDVERAAAGPAAGRPAPAT